MLGSSPRLWASGSSLQVSGSSPAMCVSGRSPKPALLGRSEKVIVRCVLALCLCIFVSLIAGIVSRLAAVRVHALDFGDLREGTFSGVAHHIHEEPRNGI